jgi:hypothetical protein
MTGNRVEELESRVRELEATLSGLTDELLDTKDRLETVERSVAGDGTADHRSDIVDGELLGDEKRDAGTDSTDEADESGNDTATDAETEGTTESADAAGTDEEAENVEETDGIIVA